MFDDESRYKIREQIKMLQERFDGKTLEDGLITLIEDAYSYGRIYERGYRDGYHQGDVDNNPLYDRAIGGFHGDIDFLT
jgi:hypothetical protein